MIQLHLVGIGSGNPEHLTLQAIRTLDEADMILLPRKGEEKSELADLRRQIVDQYLPSRPKVVEFDYPVRDSKTPKYLDGVNMWHDALASIWAQLISEHGSHTAKIALMVWGDPSLYDSTLRIADRLTAQGLSLNVKVVPGITSLQMLTAAHGIPLNELGAPVQITTGRQLRDHGWPSGTSTIAVMLDGENSFRSLSANADDLEIYWGAYVGMPQQILLHGTLADCAEEIIAKRQAARAEHGWIMDIYLLHKNSS